MFEMDNRGVITSRVPCPQTTNESVSDLHPTSHNHDSAPLYCYSHLCIGAAAKKVKNSSNPRRGKSPVEEIREVRARFPPLRQDSTFDANAPHVSAKSMCMPFQHIGVTIPCALLSMC